MRWSSIHLLTLLVGCHGQVGAPCESPEDCRSPPAAECRDWPGGYCTGPCVRAADCGPGGACIEADDRGGSCLRVCSDEVPCRPGYGCRGTLQGVTVCWPE